MHSGYEEEIYVDELIERYPALTERKHAILEAYRVLRCCFSRGNKLLVAGNGGSASDAQHIVAELMKGFISRRSLEEEQRECLRQVDPVKGEMLAQKLQKALPAIALDGHMALYTAFANDVDPVLCYAQQINGYGHKGDVFLAISTSGNSENILYAAVAARAQGMRVIGFTGAGGGRLSEFSDVLVDVPQKETFRVQELQLPIYHCWCRMLERAFYSD